MTLAERRTNNFFSTLRKWSKIVPETTFDQLVCDVTKALQRYNCILFAIMHGMTLLASNVCQSMTKYIAIEDDNVISPFAMYLVMCDMYMYLQ